MDKVMEPHARQSYPPCKQYEDNIIYADDATLLLQQEPPQQTITRLQNYSKLTQKRQIKIQWGDAELLTRKVKGHQKKTYPPRYNKINCTTEGKYWGKSKHARKTDAIHKT